MAEVGLLTVIRDVAVWVAVGLVLFAVESSFDGTDQSTVAYVGLLVAAAILAAIGIRVAVLIQRRQDIDPRPVLAQTGDEFVWRGQLVRDLDAADLLDALHSVTDEMTGYLRQRSARASGVRAAVRRRWAQTHRLDAGRLVVGPRRYASATATTYIRVFRNRLAAIVRRGAALGAVPRDAERAINRAGTVEQVWAVVDDVTAPLARALEQRIKDSP